MNNFWVAADHRAQFEERWRQRPSYVQDFPGFVAFLLLRGETRDGAVHYVSHSTWSSQEAFEQWTKSDNFVQAHRGTPLPHGMVLAPPKVECFDVVISNG
jgi:heme-degrading monooxygenase HmoA